MVLKVTKVYARHTTSGTSLPGKTFEPIDVSEHKPNNPGGPHWQKQFGNWNSKRGATFDCTPGTEYEYKIDIVIRWAFQGIAIAGGDEPATGGIGEEGGETLQLSAQEICGHGSY